MKKNLFYLFALICSMSLFTACSDDDEEDTGWIVYQDPTEFAAENATFTVNGTPVAVQEEYPLKLTATSATTGKLVIGYTGSSTGVYIDTNYEMDVTLVKDGLGYKVLGEKEYKAGYMLKVEGRVEGTKMTMALTTSGYASISGEYSVLSKNLTATFNSAAVEVAGLSQPSVKLSTTSATAGTLRLNAIIPGAGAFTNGSFDAYVDVPITLTISDDTYSFKGELKGNDTYSASTITVDGQVLNGKMTLAITHKMASDAVGDWKVKMANAQQAEVVFNFHTADGKTEFSDELMALVANAGNPAIAAIIKKEMTDAELSGVVKTLLSTYVPNLNGINFTETGDVTLKFTTLGATEPTEIAGMLNFIIKDGAISLVPNMGALMGMMSTNTKAYNPNGILSGDGIPFNFKVENGDLTLSIAKDVPMGLLPIVQGLILPMLGEMIDAPTMQMINVILTDVTTILSKEGTTLEVGIVMTK